MKDEGCDIFSQPEFKGEGEEEDREKDESEKNIAFFEMKGGSREKDPVESPYAQRVEGAFCLIDASDDENGEEGGNGLIAVKGKADGEAAQLCCFAQGLPLVEEEIEGSFAEKEHEGEL